MERWIELRDEHNHLYGRLDLASMRLDSKVNGRRACFDLLATVREQRPIVIQADAPRMNDNQPVKTT